MSISSFCCVLLETAIAAEALNALRMNFTDVRIGNAYRLSAAHVNTLASFLETNGDARALHRAAEQKIALIRFRDREDSGTDTEEEENLSFARQHFADMPRLRHAVLFPKGVADSDEIAAFFGSLLPEPADAEAAARPE